MNSNDRAKVTSQSANYTRIVQKLIIKQGDYCLARRKADDAAELVLAVVVAQVDEERYILRFSEEQLEVNSRDIAPLTTGLYDSDFLNFNIRGLRVAVYVLGRFNKSKKYGWYTGTFFGENQKKGELVLLDNEKEVYVPVPRGRGDEGYETAIKPIKNGDSDGINKKIQAARLVVMKYQSFASTGTKKRFHPEHCVRIIDRARYLAELFNILPRVRFHKVPVGAKVFVFTSLATNENTPREKHDYEVIGEEGMFVCLRRIIPAGIPGFDCKDRECQRPDHRHTDEMVFKASTRIRTVQIPQQSEQRPEENGQISRRRKLQMLNRMSKSAAPVDYVDIEESSSASKATVSTPASLELSAPEIKRSKVCLYEKTVAPTTTRAPLAPHSSNGMRFSTIAAPATASENMRRKVSLLNRSAISSPAQDSSSSLSTNATQAVAAAPVRVPLTANEIRIRRVKENRFIRTEVATPELPPLSSLPPHASCGPDCLNWMDGDPNESRFHRNSPLHTPLICGWRRKANGRNDRRNGRKLKHRVSYFGPCGKKMESLSAIVEYLRATRSSLTIDCFSFDEHVDTSIFITVAEEFVRNRDVANGLEGIPIPVVNSVDNEAAPLLEYAKKRFAYDETVNLATISNDFCTGCSCEGDCSDSERCECQQLSKQALEQLPESLQCTDEPHYSYRRLHTKLTAGIFECNSQCLCQKNCMNRVVQNSMKYPVQIFKTAQSGYGVRALTDIPEGAFLCNYEGAILNDNLAEDMKNLDDYFADLDLVSTVETAKAEVDNETDFGFDEDLDGSEGDSDDDDDENDEDFVMETIETTERTIRTRGNAAAKKIVTSVGERSSKSEKATAVDTIDTNQKSKFQWDEYFGSAGLFVVDARQKGNVGRFLNHSCDPNVHVQHVFYDTHDLRLPYVSFFTKKLVKAGEELRWDYGYTATTDGPARLMCSCGTEACRRRLL